MKQDSDGFPVACRLSDSEFRKREATLLAQFKSALTATEELPDGYIFRVSGSEQCLAVVCQLIVAERECCPFLTFALTAQPNMGPLSIRVTGPAGTKELLKTIFAISENQETHTT